jgi:hypothetical protein
MVSPSTGAGWRKSRHRPERAGTVHANKSWGAWLPAHYWLLPSFSCRCRKISFSEVPSDFKLNDSFAPEAEVPATSEDQPGDAGGMNARQATRKQLAPDYLCSIHSCIFMALVESDCSDADIRCWGEDRKSVFGAVRLSFDPGPHAPFEMVGVISDTGGRHATATFISLLSGAAVTSISWPHALHSQQPERIRRIGWLENGRVDDPAVQARTASAKQELEKLGWGSAAILRSINGGPSPASGRRSSSARSFLALRQTSFSAPEVLA